MSYIKYNTLGFVIGGANIGEGSRVFNIFTKDFGLIRVRAQGIRELKSKLKYNLQNLFLVNINLIRGKNGWHITESYKVKDLNYSFKENKIKLRTSSKILLLLKRVLGEEDSNLKLFDIMNEGLTFMESDLVNKEDIPALESLIVLRALRSLGYIEENEKFRELLESSYYNKEYLEEAKRSKRIIIEEINKSIKASDL